MTEAEELRAKLELLQSRYDNLLRDYKESLRQNALLMDAWREAKGLEPMIELSDI